MFKLLSKLFLITIVLTISSCSLMQNMFDSREISITLKIVPENHWAEYNALFVQMIDGKMQTYKDIPDISAGDNIKLTVTNSVDTVSVYLYDKDSSDNECEYEAQVKLSSDKDSYSVYYFSSKGSSTGDIQISEEIYNDVALGEDIDIFNSVKRIIHDGKYYYFSDFTSVKNGGYYIKNAPEDLIVISLRSSNESEVERDDNGSIYLNIDHDSSYTNTTKLVKFILPEDSKSIFKIEKVYEEIITDVTIMQNYKRHGNVIYNKEYSNIKILNLETFTEDEVAIHGSNNIDDYGYYNGKYYFFDPADSSYSKSTVRWSDGSTDEYPGLKSDYAYYFPKAEIIIDTDKFNVYYDLSAKTLQSSSFSSGNTGYSKDVEFNSESNVFSFHTDASGNTIDVWKYDDQFNLTNLFDFMFSGNYEQHLLTSENLLVVSYDTNIVYIAIKPLSNIEETVISLNHETNKLITLKDLYKSPDEKYIGLRIEDWLYIIESGSKSVVTKVPCYGSIVVNNDSVYSQFNERFFQYNIEEIIGVGL